VRSPFGFNVCVWLSGERTIDILSLSKTTIGMSLPLNAPSDDRELNDRNMINEVPPLAG